MPSSLLEVPFTLQSAGPAPGINTVNQGHDASFTVYPLSAFGASGDDAVWINFAFYLAQNQPLSNSANTPPTVRLASGFQFNTKTQITVPSPGCVFDLNGSSISYSGSGGIAVYMHGPHNQGDPQPYPNNVRGSQIFNGVIDGTNAGALSTGLSYGDGEALSVFRVTTSNFNQIGSVGVTESNLFGYTEKGYFYYSVYNCTTCVVFDSPSGGGGDNSHFYNYHDIHLEVNTGQNAIVWQNSAGMRGSFFRLRGNFYPGSGTNGVCLNFSGISGSDTCHIDTSLLLIDVETTGSGSSTWQTIDFGTNVSQAGIHNCVGVILFADNNWTNSNVQAGQFIFGGYINNNDPTLIAANQAPTGWIGGYGGTNYISNAPGQQNTTSTTPVMLGFNQSFTPQYSGTIDVEWKGYITTATAPVAVTIGARHGTGTAPTNGQADTGSRINGTGDPGMQPPAAGEKVHFSFRGIISGLTVGQASWFDLIASTANAADQCQVTNAQIIVREI